MKKILNILVSISLIATGSTAVVACGSNPPNLNDQKLVDDVVNRLDKQTFNVDEIKTGSKIFSDYKSTVLQDIKSNLNDQEKGLVRFPSSDDDIKLDTNAKEIDVHIQSHQIQNDIDVPVKLNYDAQSIANAINAKTITVLQTGGYKPSESANKYTTKIGQQIKNLLTPAEKQSNYTISGWENANIYWPYWKGSKKTGHEVDPNKPIPLTIEIGTDTAQASITLEFQYYEQKKVLNDQRIASEETPLPVHMGSHKTINPPWDQATIGELDDEWKFMGGLTNSLYSDVVYEPVVLKKGIPVLVKMYFKDGLFNYTKNNPLSFHVEGN